MSGSATPTPPPSSSSVKKRKYEEVEQAPPPLPSDGSVLYIALYALPAPKRRGGVLDYRWTFLLAPDDQPKAHGRQYLVREASPKIDPRNAAGSSKGPGILGQGLEDPGVEQQQRRFDRLPTSGLFAENKNAQKSTAWEFEIQHVSPETSREARAMIQLPRVQDVEIFEALIKDAFLESDGARGTDWNPVMWMGDAWATLIEAGDVLGVGGFKSEPITWGTVLKIAMEFVTAQESKERLNDPKLTFRVPTWGLLERRLIS